MKVAILLFSIAIYAFSFSFILNSGKENGESYAVLHLKNKIPFVCNSEILDFNKIMYECEIATNQILKLDESITQLVDTQFTPTQNGYKLKIIPKANSRLINADKKLYFNENISNLPINSPSKHYFIVISKKLSEFEKQNFGIDFPISFNYLKRPSIGALDLNKMPIEYASGDDIRSYLAIKKLYQSELFERVADECENAIKLYPKSIFRSEFELFRLLAFDKIIELNLNYKNITSQDIIDISKQWLKIFSSDENYTQVLYLMVKAYLNQDLKGDAFYILDTLSKEHPDDKFTKLAIIKYAYEIYKEGKAKDATKLLEGVLYSAKDVEIASDAALKLAQISISLSKFKQAKEYILKITNANKNYLLGDKNALNSISQAFFNKKMYEICEILLELFVENSKKTDDFYEENLKNLGISLSKLNKREKAHLYLNRYKKEFPNGAYLNGVQGAIDEMFFDANDTNLSQKSAYYDELIKRYENDEIGIKALQHKIDLLFLSKKYDEILTYEDKIKAANQPDINATLHQSALILANEAIVAKNCKKAVFLDEKFGVSQKIANEFKFFDCLMDTARFEAAYEFAQKRTKTTNLANLAQWLLKFTKILSKMQKFNQVIDISAQALGVAASLEYTDISEILFYRFDAFLQTNRLQDAISTLEKIENKSPNSPNLMTCYDKIAKFTLLNQNYELCALYAKKLIETQERLKSKIYSPNVDFIYMNALSKTGQNKDAANVGINLLNTRLSPENRMRALYQTAEILMRLGHTKEAKFYIDECVNSNFDNAWKDLCRAQSKMLE